MRIELTLTLRCSCERAWRIFDDPANLPRWQTSLEAVELLAGTPGQVGARTRLTYREGGRTIVMTETVLERNAPERYCCNYESALLTSSIDNTFVARSPGETDWTMVQEAQFHGLLRLLAPLTRPLTMRKFREDMNRFQRIAEHGGGLDARWNAGAPAADKHQE